MSLPSLPIPRQRLNALLAAAALAATSSASAAPFATTTTGVVGDSGFPSVATGQPYSVTLVFDNGGATTADQTWEASDLTCVLWRFNMAHNVVYAQNLAATPPTVSTGAASTDAGGAMDGMFSELAAQTVAPGAYSASGFAPALGDANWFINGLNAMFFTGVNDTRIHGNPAGVSVNPADWSNPVPFTGSCAAPASHPSATPVPTLGHAGLALMAALLGALGWRMRRRGA